MKVSEACDSIAETDWISTHQSPTRPERERDDPHVILRQATKDGKGRYSPPKEVSSLEQPRHLRPAYLFHEGYSGCVLGHFWEVI